MTREEQKSANPVFEQACDWFLKLNNSADETLLNDFQAWLDQDPNNEAAYLEVLSMWQSLDDIDSGFLEPAEVMVRQPTPNERSATATEPLQKARPVSYLRRFTQTAALAACAALIAFLTPGYLWQPADYSTATAEQRVIELDDGSRLHLSAQSAVNIDYSSGARDIELLYGEAFFEVAKDLQRPFRVRSDTQTVQALGTAFNIRMLDKQIQTTLTEGRIKVDLAEQASLFIDAGQRIEWAGADEYQIQQGDYPYWPGWKRNIVRLDRMPVRDVVQLLNRHYTPVFRLVNPESGDKTLQGTLPLNNLKMVKKVLQSTADLQLSEFSEQLILIY